MGDRSPAGHRGGAIVWPAPHSAFVYWVMATAEKGGVVSEPEP